MLRKLEAGVRRWYSRTKRQLLAREPIVLVVLILLAVGIGVAATGVSPAWFPPSAVFLALLAGGLALRVRTLAVLIVVVLAVLLYDASVLGSDEAGPGLFLTAMITAAFAWIMARTRELLGVGGLRGEQMLLELRDRLRRQGQAPPLPRDWQAKTSLVQAGGSSFGGDFVISALSEDGATLRLAVIDVSGKGVDAGTRALLLSGAFGGMLGSLSAEQFLPACNAYLRQLSWNEGFATAVYLALDLETGAYLVESAGHPPPVKFDAGSGTWRVTQSQGVVLGVLDNLVCTPERGTLQSGDALLLYTDGLVERPGIDIDVGIDRLIGETDRLVAHGLVDGLDSVVRAISPRHSDDCALVMVRRVGESGR